MISEHSKLRNIGWSSSVYFRTCGFPPTKSLGLQKLPQFDTYKETKTNAPMKRFEHVTMYRHRWWTINHKLCSFVSTKMDSGDEGEQRLGEESCCLIFTIVSCSKATSAAGGEPPINSQSDDRDLEGATRPSSIPPPQCRVALLNTSRNSVSRSDYWSMTGSSPTASTNFRWPTDGAEWNSTCFLPTITYIKQTSGSS
jgi:hypothetical protein